MGEAIVTFVVGRGSLDQKRPAHSAREGQVEKHHIRMANGIIRLIGDFSRNGSAGPQTEDQILRFESRSNHDRGRKTLVLLVRLSDVAAMTRGEDIFAGKHTGENKTPVRGRDFHAGRIR